MTWGDEYDSATYGDRRVAIGNAEWTSTAGSDATDSVVKSYDTTGALVQTLTRTATFDYKQGTAWDFRNPLDQPAPQSKAKVTITVGRDGDGKSDCTMTFMQPPTYRLVWSDDFSGTTLDTAKWNARNNTTLDYDQAYITSRSTNLTVSAGLLHIKSVREALGGRPWTTAYVDTIGKASWTYGRVEARMKMPTQATNSKGIWPALWMRPDDGFQGCEIDNMEALGSSASEEVNRTHEAIHRTYSPKVQQDHTTDWAATGGPSGAPSDGFHVYGLEWTSSSIAWSIDGAEVYRRDANTTPWFAECFQRPFNFRLNQQVGGSWPGSPTSTTLSPADFQIDYIRVYQK